MKIANIAAIAAIALMASGCNVLDEDNSSSYSPIYEKMGSQEVAEFGTVQYTVGKIVKTSDMPQTFWDKFKIGDRKALIRCTATLKAGIDISSGNYKVEVDGKKVLLQLPHAKIFEPINMDFDNVHLEYSKVGLLRSSFSLAEYVAYLQEGEAAQEQFYPRGIRGVPSGRRKTDTRRPKPHQPNHKTGGEQRRANVSLDAQKPRF